MEEEKGQDIPVVETPPAETETVESLKSKLAEYETRLSEREEKLTQAEKGLQTARKTASEKTREAKEAKELRSLISSITSRLDAHEEILKYKDEDDDDTPKKRTNLDERLAEIKSKGTQEVYNTLVNEAQEIAQSMNLDIRTAPELKVHRALFKTGDINAAREAISLMEEMKESKVVEPKTEPKDEPKKPDENEIKRLIDKGISEGVNAYLKEKGLLTPEGGVPAGTSSDETFWKEWGEGKIESTPANLKKAMEIQKSRS